MRTRTRDGDPTPRLVPVADTALWHGLEIEVARLRALLVKHGIDPDGDE